MCKSALKYYCFLLHKEQLCQTQSYLLFYIRKKREPESFTNFFYSFVHKWFLTTLIKQTTISDMLKGKLGYGTLESATKNYKYTITFSNILMATEILTYFYK